MQTQLAEVCITWLKFAKNMEFWTWVDIELAFSQG